MESERPSAPGPRKRASQAKLQVAMADASHQVYAEIQRMSTQLSQQATRQEHMMDNLKTLYEELLHGRSGNPSLKTQVVALSTKVDSITDEVKSVKKDVNDVEIVQRHAADTQRQQALVLTEATMSQRTKIILAVLSILGVIVTSLTTYLIARATGTAPNMPAPPTFVEPASSK